jgi:hypothetical protein
MSFAYRIGVLSSALLLGGMWGCGSSGDPPAATVDPPPAPAPGPAPAPAPSAPTVSRAVLETPASGTVCAENEDPDVFTGTRFETSHPIGARPWGCLIVPKSESVPAYDGERAMRFEVRPGDCSASAIYSDCENDRNRHEINESGVGPTQGRQIAWETRLYIPPQPRIRPAGGNALFLSQINYIDGPVYGTVAYLELSEAGELVIRTHVGLSFDIANRYVVDTQPIGRWIRLRYELVSSSGNDGRLRVLVDDVLKVDEARQTLPSVAGTNWLKLGIYNAFRSQAIEPYDTQVVYFDDIRRSVR